LSSLFELRWSGNQRKTPLAYEALDGEFALAGAEWSDKICLKTYAGKAISR
jgi:hypothetical protein